MAVEDGLTGFLDEELRDAAQRQPYIPFADPVKARRSFRRAIALSRALRGPLPEEDEVDFHDTVFRAPDDGREIPVRIYEPIHRERSGALPVLVYYHGGGFIGGDLDTEHDRCLQYSKGADCAVVAVGYRLAPEFPFPAGVEDCYAGLCGVVSAAGEHGWDPGRLAVGGSSAGGTLAAAVALMCRDRGGPRLALQLLLYPTLDDRLVTEMARELPGEPGGESPPSIWRLYVGDQVDDLPEYAAPARCTDFTGVAPAYLLVAEVDALREEEFDYACQMMRDGVSVELHCYAKVFHGFELAAPDAVISRRARADQMAALRAAFARGGAG